MRNNPKSLVPIKDKEREIKILNEKVIPWFPQQPNVNFMTRIIINMKTEWKYKQIVLKTEPQFNKQSNKS